jgi:hypothetical protein
MVLAVLAISILYRWSSASGFSTKPSAEDDKESAPDSLPAASPPVTFYDSDPQHLWNRLHKVLWVRTGQDGKEYGHDRLDPLLWLETRYLVEGLAHERALQVLDEFLAKRGEQLVKDPLKRAVLQRDLWAVFDWTADPNANTREAYLHRAAPPRRALQVRLARAIQRLALTPAEISALPDNYAAALNSRAFARTHEPTHPERPFLPADLFQKDGPWVEVEIDNGSAVTATRHVYDFGQRSSFRVFLRLPQGRQATIAYFDQLRDFPRPWVMKRERNQKQETLVLNPGLPQFPADTQTALVRQMLVIDKDGRIATTSVTESLQIRVFQSIPQLAEGTVPQRGNAGVQDVYEFNRTRALLFADKQGGLRPVGDDDKDFRTQLQVHGFDEFELPKDNAPFRARMGQTMRMCKACHDRPGIFSIQSYVGGNFPRGQYYLPDVQPNNRPDSQGELSAMLKRQQFSWGLLQGLWE